MEGSGCDLM